MNYRFGLMVLSILTSMNTMAIAEVPKNIAPNNIFVPKGFDSNDQTEVILSGWLPSPCFLKPKAEVKVLGKTIYVSLKAVDKASDVCVTLAYPFLVSAAIGALREGEYKVVVNARSDFRREASVEIGTPAANSIDDFIYAHVEDVFVDAANRTVTLTGSNPSDCVELDAIRFLSNDKDTIAVLPVMKQVRATCEKKMVPFEYKFDLPNLLPANQGDTLLHVRSLDGTSLNRLIRRGTQN